MNNIRSVAPIYTLGDNLKETGYCWLSVLLLLSERGEESWIWEYEWYSDEVKTLVINDIIAHDVL